jgi:hypothetical protein
LVGPFYFSQTGHLSFVKKVLLLPEEIGEAKVRNFDIEVGVQEKVFRLQVPMYNTPVNTRAFSLRLSNRVPTPSPLRLRVAKTGKNHLNEETTPILHTGIGE